MGKVGSNAGGVDDIVEGKLVDERGELEEQGQGLQKMLANWSLGGVGGMGVMLVWKTNLSDTARGASNNFWTLLGRVRGQLREV